MNPMQHGAGQHVSPALPLHPSQRRDYHAYHHQSPSPVPPTIYSYHPQYYPHPAAPHYQWRAPYPQQHYVPSLPPPPQQQQQQQQQQHMQQPYQPRSPMVVSSQPHNYALTMAARHPNPMPSPSQTAQSPRPIPPYMQQQSSLTSPSPAPATVAKVECPRVETPTSQPATTRRPSTATNPLSLPPEHKQPFWPTLPWYSVPETRSTFPVRAIPKRRRRRHLRAPNDAVALPTRKESAEQEQAAVQTDSRATSAEEPASETSTIAAPSEPETPATSQAPSEDDFMQGSALTTPAQANPLSSKPVPIQQQHARRDTRTAIAVPIIPGLPKTKELTTSSAKQELGAGKSQESAGKTVEDEHPGPDSQATAAPSEATISQPPQPKPGPKSWADLVRRSANPESSALVSLTKGEAVANGTKPPPSASLADSLRQYDVHSDARISFLEPRGLANTGNMCYMNSILQILVFCVPFYNFLDKVRQRTAHSMKSETPLVDAMIMFMGEFKVLASAESVGALRSLLKQEQLEQYGEPVTLEYVYDVIRKLPRFAGMRRGHQQDAEEFFGFLLEGLHDECVQVMQGHEDGHGHGHENGVTSSPPDTSTGPADGWLEVGPRQRASVTRTAGQHDVPSPVTKIFGGHLRSELRVTGLKDSVTREPYKPLQLDIGGQHVNNIVDALKGLTRTEALSGDFGGKSNMAKKQVFIDTLPPILILHLKRFQYDNAGGTQKIWKKVGYPLELEIPKDVFPPAKRGALAMKAGLPTYRLTGVVYHHGKSAAGGHYTVDVLREDRREWIRMDDTIIRRIRPEDVAEGGSEEDPKVLAKALEQHKADQELQQQRNMYQGLDESEMGADEEKLWSEVNGHPHGQGKKWNGGVATANGTNTPTSAGKRTPTARNESIRDNKVAYILLYEKMRD